MGKRRLNLRSVPSEGECQRFAEQFADCILDPRQIWLAQYVATGGLTYVPTEEEIASGTFAFKVLASFEKDTVLMESSVYEALTKPDRGALAAWILKRTKKCRLSGNQMSRLLACGNSTVLRKSLKALGQRLTFYSGAKPKLPADQYSTLPKTAELLQPAVLKLLAMPKSSRTLRETIRYLKKDYPQACEFLSRHLPRFEEALDDPILLLRAKKNLKGRARVLAEAMAGADYQLSFSTSRERVRRARKLVATRSS